MNTRIILYAVVGVFVVLMMQGGGGQGGTALTLGIRQQSALKNECMKEIIGFEQSAKSKFAFCECVTSSFEEKLKANEKLVEAHAAFVAKYLELRESPKSISRSLASTSSSARDFSTGEDKLDIVLSSLDLRYSFAELKELVPLLAEGVDSEWKNAMIGCSQLETPHVEGGLSN